MGLGGKVAVERWRFSACLVLVLLKNAEEG